MANRFSTFYLAFIVLLFFGTPAHAQRLILNEPTTFWISPSGNDTGISCTQAAPCKTIPYAVSVAQQWYDLAGQTLTFNACGLWDTTYTTGVSLTGPNDFVGHSNGPGQIIFLGDANNPAGCLIKPSAGNCLGAAFGAQYEIEGFKCDESIALTDEISVGQGAHIIINGFVFGNAYNPGNDLTVVAGTVDFASGYSAQKTIVQTTVSLTAGSRVFQVANTAGIVPGMMATGAGIPIQNVVQSVNPGGWPPNTVVLNVPPTSSTTNSTIFFVAGGQTHMDVANGGVVLFDTNCGQAPFSVNMGWAGYYDSMFHVAEDATIDLGASWSGNVVGYSYSVHTNSVLDTCGGVPGQGTGPVDTGGQVH
jgi:hypothetical protein